MEEMSADEDDDVHPQIGQVIVGPADRTTPSTPVKRRPSFTQEEMDSMIKQLIQDLKFRRFMLDPHEEDDGDYTEILKGGKRSVVLAIILREMVDRLLSEPDVTKIGPVPAEEILDFLFKDLLRRTHSSCSSVRKVMEWLTWGRTCSRNKANENKLNKGKFLAPEISQTILDRAMTVTDELLSEYITRGGRGDLNWRLWLHLVSSEEHDATTSNLHLQRHQQLLDNVIMIALSLPSSPFRDAPRKVCLQCLPGLINRIESNDTLEAVYESLRRHWKERNSLKHLGRPSNYSEERTIRGIMHDVLRALNPPGLNEAIKTGRFESGSFNNEDIRIAKLYILEVFTIFSPCIEVPGAAGGLMCFSTNDSGMSLLNSLIRNHGENVADDAFLQSLIDIPHCFKNLNLRSTVTIRLMNLLLERLRQPSRKDDKDKMRQGCGIPTFFDPLMDIFLQRVPQPPQDDEELILSLIHPVAMYLGTVTTSGLTWPLLDRVLENRAWTQTLFRFSGYTDSFFENCMKFLSIREYLPWRFSAAQAKKALLMECLDGYAQGERRFLLKSEDCFLDFGQWLERKLAEDSSFRIEESAWTLLVVCSELERFEAQDGFGFAMSDTDAFGVTFEHILLEKPDARKAFGTGAKLFQSSPLLLKWFKKQSVLDMLGAAERRNFRKRGQPASFLVFMKTWMYLLWNNPLAAHKHLSKVLPETSMRELLAHCAFENALVIRRAFERRQPDV